MSSNQLKTESSEETYIRELLAQLEEPIHKRLIQAYSSGKTVQAMEAELRNIITEVLHSED